MGRVFVLRRLLLALAVLRPEVTAEKFRLTKLYNATNFLDQFTFNTTGTVSTQPDDNWSFVSFQNRENATAKKLAVTRDGEIYLGVDSTTVLDPAGPGRDSLRLVSRDAFKYGLLITRFSHLPTMACGAWPAYWTLGVGEWPNAGEIDMYEGWNLQTENKPAFRVGPADKFGDCTTSQTGQHAKVLSNNCDNKAADNKTQFLGQGCQSVEERNTNTMWASPTGGTQALEWTRDYIKVFTWPRSHEPPNLEDGVIDTSGWGDASIQLSAKKCNIDKAFQEQRIMFTLPMCGNPVQSEEFWTKVDGGAGITCDKVTGTKNCSEYVAKNPQAFKDFYFQIRDMRLFQSVSGSPPTVSPTPGQPIVITYPVGNPPSLTSTTLSGSNFISSTSTTIHTGKPEFLPSINPRPTPGNGPPQVIIITNEEP